MDRNVQCLRLTARPGKVLATFKQKYACIFPCAYRLTKNKHSLIRNLCTTPALLYFSPMTQSINVKSSSLSKNTNFYGNQPSEFCLREKEMLNSESSIRDVHWRGLCSLQRVELHPNANCLCACFTSLVHTTG